MCYNGNRVFPEKSLCIFQVLSHYVWKSCYKYLKINFDIAIGLKIIIKNKIKIIDLKIFPSSVGFLVSVFSTLAEYLLHS